MLHIENQDHFDAVMLFAAEHGLQHKFGDRIKYLSTYAEHGDVGKTRCRLGWDFAPQSFSFTMEKRQGDGEYVYWFNGGLIFHQANSNGVENPVLSVRVGAHLESDWGVHT